jgi:RNA polymerase sigma-70 factor (ECF subfamily)
MHDGPELDTQELLRLARRDPDGALGPLLQRFRHYLQLLARLEIGRRLQGKVDPSDVVQEVFLEAHRHFDRFRGREEGELACWLRQILAARLAKLVRRYLRTQGRDVRLERELAADIDRSSQMLDRGLVAPENSPSQQAARREQGLLLAESLARLPEHYREVLILRHLEELSFPEIAMRLGRTLDSVKNLWARALAQLREVAGAAP